VQDLSIAHDSPVYLSAAEAGNAVLHPNHLLYGPLAVAFVKCFDMIGFSAHRALTTLDGLAGGLSMALVGLILVRRGKLSHTDAAISTMPIGLSFGVWFYSAAIEVYLPALVPLLGGLYLLAGPMERSRDWAVAGALHAIATLLHQSHILFAPVPVLRCILSCGPAGQKARRLAIYVAVATAFVGPTYILAAMAMGANTGLRGFVTWAAGYAGEPNTFWAAPPNNFVKAAAGLIRSQVGGLFVFAVPQLSNAIAAVFPFEPWDGPFLVRYMSSALGWAMTATMALAGLLVAAVLAIALGCIRSVIEAGPRRLIMLLFASTLSYSAFFCFWQPHNPELWIAQSIFIWLILGTTLLSIDRQARVGAWLIGAVGICYALVTFAGSILPARDVRNDYFIEIFDSIPEGAPPSLVMVRHQFPLEAYARLAGYAPVLAADKLGDRAFEIAQEHLVAGGVVLLVGELAEETAWMSERLGTSSLRVFSENGQSVRIEPQR
jgi:hypothetical protein